MPRVTQLPKPGPFLARSDSRQHTARSPHCCNRRQAVQRGTLWLGGGPIWPVLKPTSSDSSPQQNLGLQPGQLVRLKSKHAIELTLNRHSRNRGLEFGKDMLFYCGGSYRVAASINRIVHEGTGELLMFKTPSILLEGVTSVGGTTLCPQNEYYFWREIWIEPEPFPPLKYLPAAVTSFSPPRSARSKRPLLQHLMRTIPKPSPGQSKAGGSY